MKRILLTYFILFLTLNIVVAGEKVDRPLLQKGKVWNYDYTYVDISFQRHHGSAIYRTEGDTIIDGRRLFRMCLSNSEKEGQVFRQLWYEKDGKVYTCDDKGRTADLVYDFTLSAGDDAPDHTVSAFFPDGFKVVSSDSILVRGILRKRLVLTNPGHNEKVVWVEGIGGTKGLDEPIMRMVGDGREYTLLSCYLDDECIFEKEDFDAPPYRQDPYTDMLAEGKTWHFIRWPYGKIHTEGIRGDSIVNGMTCKKYGYVNYDGSFSCTALFRQEGDRVYHEDGKTGISRLLFDFGASKGDTIIWGNDEAKLVVTGTGTVRARGHELRTVTFIVTGVNYPEGWLDVPAEDRHELLWTEGMGSYGGPVTDPRPDVAGNYNILLGVSCNGELLYDEYILGVSDFEKMMFSYEPVWEYGMRVWNKDTEAWEEGVRCRAMKTGSELPPPGNFVYHSISVEEGGGCRLLLRQGDKVYAEKNSYREYIKKVFPGEDDIFEEQGEWPLDVVLYDFSLNVGDRYPCRGEVTVESVSSLTTREGISRRLLLLSNGMEILEGVGCLNSPYGVFAYQNDPGTGSQGKERVASLRGDAASGMGIQSFRKYGSDSDPVFIIGDVELGITLSKTERVADGTIHDLQGRRLNGTPQKGIYIQNGRKYVR